MEWSGEQDEDLYLYQNVMIIYQNGISKFSLCTSLRIIFFKEKKKTTQRKYYQN